MASVRTLKLRGEDSVAPSGVWRQVCATLPKFYMFVRHLAASVRVHLLGNDWYLATIVMTVTLNLQDEDFRICFPRIRSQVLKYSLVNA